MAGRRRVLPEGGRLQRCAGRRHGLESRQGLRNQCLVTRTGKFFFVFRSRKKLEEWEPRDVHVLRGHAAGGVSSHQSFGVLTFEIQKETHSLCFLHLHGLPELLRAHSGTYLTRCSPAIEKNPALLYMDHRNIFH
ncbi:hypothetical protein DV515_00016080 [Chloebia gouldiae]|uniref:Uncharacterized protein n=1 Tax=Chloebia gouldiae TaxID=44316 RepID=A0A3L8RUT3_CHLGU|nr:hypothetical protein DV515_00016080 [Chloebia gouldiae]